MRTQRSPHEESQLPPLEDVSPLTVFLRQDAAAACLLLACAIAAIVLANSAARDWYENLWHVHLGISIGAHHLDQSLRHWINDGLMAVFFFLVGLEIKRELLVGELASFRKALLPAAAAVGGMVFPAMIYAIINWDTPAAHGWGIPMATDIAFATGCLGFLSKRLPPAISVFLIALAIVDDLGAVAVIAIFYTGQLAVRPLAAGCLLIALSFVLNRMGVRRTLPYAVIGAFVWYEFLESGVHATIAGVLLAFTIPANARYETPHFFRRMTVLLERFTGAENYPNPVLITGRQQSLIRSMLQECHHVEAPLQRLELALHPFCVLFVLPLFAFANSGVTLEFSNLGSVMLEPVTLGVFLGLVLGKQAGIMLAAGAAVMLGWADLPQGVRWSHMYGLSWLAGIGFTMALFIGELAFASKPGDLAMAAHITEAKIGIFLASLAGGIIGCLILWSLTQKARPAPAARRENESPTPS